MATTEPIRRMPTVFGRSLGPRQNVHGERFPAVTGGPQETTSISFQVEVPPSDLQRLLPKDATPAEGARLVVSFTQLRNIGWLAGRGYNVLMLRVPAVMPYEPYSADFCPVLWENRADPIITGREELGMPKIYAELPDPVKSADGWRVEASWDGFVFFEAEVADLEADSASVGEFRRPATFTHKYIPRTGAWGEADVDYLTWFPETTGTITSREVGKGTARFISGRWEDLPTHHHIVSALASIPFSVVSASVVTTKEAPDYYEQLPVKS